MAKSSWPLSASRYAAGCNRRGGMPLEGIIALAIAYTVGFALSGCLLSARRLLIQGQDDRHALCVMEVALQAAHQNPRLNSGQMTLAQRDFDWKAARRAGQGFREIEVTVFWKDEHQKLHHVSNARIFREGASS